MPLMYLWSPTTPDVSVLVDKSAQPASDKHDMFQGLVSVYELQALRKGNIRFDDGDNMGGWMRIPASKVIVHVRVH